jgi:hypothetical protein
MSGDQTIERIAVHVWKFARSIDEQFVQRQVFDLEISAAGWDPLFRRLGKRKLSRAILRHHFEHARMAQVQDRGGGIQNFQSQLSRLLQGVLKIPHRLTDRHKLHQFPHPVVAFAPLPHNPTQLGLILESEGSPKSEHHHSLRHVMRQKIRMFEQIIPNILHAGTTAPRYSPVESIFESKGTGNSQGDRQFLSDPLASVDGRLNRLTREDGNGGAVQNSLRQQKHSYPDDPKNLFQYLAIYFYAHIARSDQIRGLYTNKLRGRNQR